MAVPDFTPEQRLEGDDNFFDDDLNFRMPVEKRLDKFREVAVPLVTDVCARALKDAGVKAEEIGKLVVVSTTGFLGPGLDCSLIKTLGLSRGVDRSLIGYMGFWAIHPGGRRIIEEAQNGLGLSEEQAKYSWNVLSNYGNMLSPSVMFVLELILNDHKKALAKGERGLKQ